MDTAPAELYTLSLHDALPISPKRVVPIHENKCSGFPVAQSVARHFPPPDRIWAAAANPRSASGDRKSTRLNSSHRCISYAVFCLKKKKHLADRSRTEMRDHRR